MYRAICAGVLLSIVLLGATAIHMDRPQEISAPEEKIQQARHQLSDSEQLMLLEPEETIAFDHGIIYFGRPTCPQCVQLEDYILVGLESTGDEFSIAYFNTDTWRGHGLFNDILEKYHVLGIPYVVYIHENSVCDVLQISDIEDEQSSIQEVETFFKNHMEG